jgi:hypothetical protein
MFDKQFLQILAVRLSGGLSLDWEKPEPHHRWMPEEEIVRCPPNEADNLGKRADTMPV